MGNHGKAWTRGVWALTAAALVVFAMGLTAHQVAYAGTELTAQASTVTTVPSGPGDADNIKSRANTQHVLRYGWQDGAAYSETSQTVKTLDITGDGDADKIKVTTAKPSSGSPYLKKVKIAVNGKTKKTISRSNIDRVTVDVITLKNNKPFLWVTIARKNGKAVQTLYQYQDGELEAVLSNSDLAKSNVSNCTISGLSLSGNTLKATFTFVTSVTGVTKATYTYKYADGTLARTSSSTSKISYVTRKWGGFTKSKVSAACSFTAYKKTDLATAAFAVKVKKKVQPVSIKVTDSTMYYKVKYGKKTGWIECPKVKKSSKRSPNTMFYETYGKVNLKTSIPTYKKDAYYSASDLQKYSDHSLFIARNEIWARAVGKSFSTAELKKYFKSKSWYQKNRGRMFTDAESTNIDLINSIEKARGSLYI